MDKFEPVRSHDLWHLFIGTKIGEGQNRIVYEYLPNTECYVIKEEVRGDLFQNIMEWRIWNEVVNSDLEKWFAPCTAISPNGRFLIQRRVFYPERSKYPKELPQFFTDTKYQNFGLYGKHWVASDYGFPMIFKDNRFNGKMKKVKWWSDR